MATSDYTFTTFSKNEFYDALNARLVDMADLGLDKRIVDLACGTGGVTRLIVERLRDARDSVVIGMDHSAAALKQAMEDLKDARDAAVEFVQSRVEQVADAVKESVDTVVFCNAIHYIQDKDALVTEVSRALKPGGKFAFNTSFYEGGQHEDSITFYRKWMFKAARILRRDYGVSPVRSEKVESRRQLTPEQYRNLLGRHDFKIVRQKIDTVQVPIAGWLDISGFEDFIRGVMPGAPLDKASKALQEGVRQTFDELKVSHVPRNWLDVIAVRD